MQNPKVSIVICTYNRADSLERTIQSLRRLKYDDFEVIVVRGQCTDHTDKILEKYKDFIKVGKNDVVCLGRSRNIGIQLAAGTLISFLDDDAIPDALWLNDLVSLFKAGPLNLAGCGGIVYACNATFLEFGGEKVSVWGRQVKKDDPNFLLGNNKEQYDRLVGTNNLFSKNALLEVGGFDENYDWYFDECDLAIRLWKAGFCIQQHERAIVYHERGSNLVRKKGDDVTGFNWFLMTRATVYFMMQNATGSFEQAVVESQINTFYQNTLNNCKQWLIDKKISKDQYHQHVKNIKRGYEAGLELKLRNCNFELRNAAQTQFFKFKKTELPRCLAICLLCQFDPVATQGGIAKYTFEMAQGIVQNGHRVHIIYMGTQNVTKVVDNIMLHEISVFPTPEIIGLSHLPTSNRIIGYSYGLYLEIMKICAIYGLDIVDSPIWDSEGLVPAYLLKGVLPVVLRLQTPLLPACETQGWELTEDLLLSAAMEKVLLEISVHRSIDSDALLEIFEKYYDISCLRATKIYIGVEPVDVPASRDLTDKHVQFLFISRLERRKGVHTIFAALSKLLTEFEDAEMDFIGNDDYIDPELKMSYKNFFYKTYSNQGWVKRVHFLGKVDNDKKNQAIANCDVLLLPSLYESFGVPLIEAMSAHKAVIGCNVGGMVEVVGDAGVLIPVEDEQALYQQMKRLIQHPDIRCTLGEKGYQRYKQLFTKDKMVLEYLKYYTDIIQGFEKSNS